MTGLFRGAAHSQCNLQLIKELKIPVILHNLRNYDGHIITQAIPEAIGRDIKVIGQGMEKYLIISLGEHLVFKDSLMFLNTSLQVLANNLRADDPNKFHCLRHEFGNDGYSNWEIDDLTYKGVFPYDYLDSWEKLQETQLPPKDCFFNKLKNQPITDEDYQHAQRVWRVFCCETLEDYLELYLKADVLQLADVFENFRVQCLEPRNYQLDPAHYVSLPQFSWSAMLKHTAVELELITDPAMFDMIDGGMRGGISVITQRFARANNPYMGDLYDPSKPTTYLMYWDMNNLYGKAMSYPLPRAGFRWLKPDEMTKIDWIAQTFDQSTGYIVECDLEYPQHLHDLHNDYPLAPERFQIDVTMLGDKQVELLRQYDRARVKDNTKLVPNLLNKSRYVTHYLCLKFYIEHGIKLKKVNRVIEFQQSPWLAPYIEKNTNLRKQARNKCEIEMYKLMNNAIYGKTCENQKKRTNIHLVTDADKASKLINKPHCLDIRIFNEHLVGIEMRKVKANIDKPFYAGFATLELSKLEMYKFHYDVIKKRYGDKARLLFTDTDSLTNEIQTEDIYKDVFDMRHLFDLSDYPQDSPYYDPTNKKVIGMMKDELNGKVILEFVGLRAKMYSILTVDIKDNQPVYQEKQRAKGIQREAASKLRHEQYKSQLHQPEENSVITHRIGSKLHKIYAIEVCFNHLNLLQLYILTS